MPTVTLAQLESVVRASWSVETTNIDAAHRRRWDPVRPAVGQCGPTSLVVQDLLGGDLLIARVTGGAEEENHYWNRFGGLDVDLTREQFGPECVVGAPTVVIRPPEGPRKHVAAYELMRQRVFTALGLDPGPSGHDARPGLAGSAPAAG